jgi:hypothetical protein
MARNWNESYQQDFIPWDSGVPEPVLIQSVESSALPVGRASTSDAAPAPMRSGWRSTATRFWAWTSRRWRSKRRVPSCRGIVLPVRHSRFLRGEAGRRTVSAGFRSRLLPRVRRAADRAKLAAQVARSAGPDGMWLSLIGSTKGPTRDGSAATLTREGRGCDRAAPRDPVGAIVRIPRLTGAAMVWICLLRRRACAGTAVNTTRLILRLSKSKLRALNEQRYKRIPAGRLAVQPCSRAQSLDRPSRE